MDAPPLPKLTPALWLFGLPCSGKSTLAAAVARRLRLASRAVKLMDGDDLRKGLCRDLGFDAAARRENLRRAAEASRLFLDEGTTVVAAFITPFRTHRELVREILSPHPCLFVHVRCPVEVCAGRDVKGHYARAKRGEISEFTGLDGGFDVPLASERAAVVDTDRDSVEVCVETIARLMEGRPWDCRSAASPC